MTLPPSAGRKPAQPQLQEQLLCPEGRQMDKEKAQGGRETSQNAHIHILTFLKNQGVRGKIKVMLLVANYAWQRNTALLLSTLM